MKLLLSCFIFLISLPSLAAQDQARLKFFEPADTLHSGRFWTCAIGGAAIYSGVAIGLYQAWYKNYELTGFHTFNDMGEWNHMDKAGHAFGAYFETEMAFKGARWTGLSRKKSLLVGAFVGTFLQGTVEVMDGFSKKWGFSWGDIGFNTAGVGLFAAQELSWQEQRIRLKVSSNYRPPYPDDPLLSVDGESTTTLRSRADELFGYGFGETFVKDYNAMTVWASFNPSSFARQKSKIPRWLNIAVGYGAGNLYGGFANEWEDENGYFFKIPEGQYPRYRQFYLSLDIDFTRIRTRSAFLKTVFSVINWIKVPAPTLEVNTLGKMKFHPLYW